MTDKPVRFRSLLPFEQALSGRTVLLTGHTGFTGGWLGLWLAGIGCRVVGLSLAPPTEPNLFTAANIAGAVESHIGDIADAEFVRAVMAGARPDVVFHLAAQPLVSRAFDDPLGTFASNVMGTANVLEAARLTPGVTAVVTVTTDKVYRDRDWHWGYRENDELGGKDPYSASKAAAEIVTASYIQTLAARGNGVRIATARGGNIIGGGDWAANRIVPDFVRALASGTPLVLRNPASVRPWQHVMALAHAYLVLAARLLKPDAPPAAPAWNFGPSRDGARTVGDLLDGLASAWRRPDVRLEAGAFPETRFLHLDSSMARQDLGWDPPLSFADTTRLTAEWYRAYHTAPAEARARTLAQIAGYRALLGPKP